MNGLKEIAKYTDKTPILVNPDDIKTGFWNKTYLCLITRAGFPFLVNADHLQACVDYLIDYIDESHDYEGLIERNYDSEDINEQWIQGGNCSYYLAADICDFVEMDNKLFASHKRILNEQS